MQKMKVMTVVGTRPEIIRLSRVIATLNQHCQHTLVHTGQNYDYELNQVFFEQLKLPEPDIYLDAATNDFAGTIANIIARIDKVIEEVQPEALLLLGDTNSTLAAMVAKRKHIPIFHMEAGNRCFDDRVPEEMNRRIVDHISDINLPYSQIARQYLIREGIKPDQIIVTGSPMNEVLQYYKQDIDSSEVLNQLSLQENQYFLVSFHREENVDDKKNLDAFINCLISMAKQYQQPIIISTHPRTRVRLAELTQVLPPQIQILKPLGFLDYVRLQKSARLVLSDSGTITEESSILKFPALNIRNAHERPEGMEEGAVIMTGLDEQSLLRSVELMLARVEAGQHRVHTPNDYAVDNVAHKVLNVIMSYTGYIKRRTWYQSVPTE